MFMKCFVSMTIFMLLGVGLALAQPVNGLQKREAVALAKQWAETSNPPMSRAAQYVADAIYMPRENSWIVDFTDPSSVYPEYMLRVEATSGKSPDLLRGSQITRYKPYFDNASSK